MNPVAVAPQLARLAVAALSLTRLLVVGFHAALAHPSEPGRSQVSAATTGWELGPAHVHAAQAHSWSPRPRAACAVRCWFHGPKPC